LSAQNYEPPHADLLQAPSAPREEDLASTGQRFGTYLIDSVVRFVLAAAAGVALAFTESDLSGVDGQLLSFGMGVGLSTAYFVSTELPTGRTLGKLVMGTRVTSVDGQLPTFGQILGRTLARFVPFEPFSCLGDPPVGWHDRWSRTRVIRTRGPRPARASKPVGSL
jgi:uncharacterized RDD family membrane protein YckC